MKNMANKWLSIVLIFSVAIAFVLFSAGAALAWTVQDTPERTDVKGMSGSDPDNVWATGDSGKVLRYDDESGTWSIPANSPTNVSESGAIHVLDANHVWAAKEGGDILFYDGTTWTTQASGTNGTTNSISALDATHVWAAGDDSWGETSQGFVLFYDGNNWNPEPIGTTEALSSVCALDSNHVWAVGDKGTILFYDGTSWKKQASGVTYNLKGVTTVDATHVWAVGNGGCGNVGVILFYDGSKWSTQWTNVDEKERPGLYSIAALDAEHVWAGGELGTILVFDGIAWTKDLTVPRVSYYDIFALDMNHVWAWGLHTWEVLFDNPGSNRYYFAEGTTRAGFSEWLCLQNPGDDPIEVKATYMLFGADPIEKTYPLQPTSRESVNVNEEVGPGQDVSVMLESNSTFYAERPMYFNYKQGVPGFSWIGGHCATGTTSTGTDWYFAEGTTRAGFEEWVCIQNPNDKTVSVMVNYIFAGAYTQQKIYDIQGRSRISVFVNGDVGPDQDLSLHVHCDTPIVAERPMYFNYHDKWTGGHVVMGTDRPKENWYFAEGSTRPGYEEYLAVQNANNAEAELIVRFLKKDGTEQVGTEMIGANSRWTLNVNETLGPGEDSSISLECDQPIVAERPMYFSYKEAETGYSWEGGHDVIGAPQPKTKWFFAEGCTRDNFEEYICIGNPGEETADVTLKFMLKEGDPVPHTLSIASHQRATINVADIVGRGHDVSTEVISYKPIVVERPMYFSYKGVWPGGHDVIGY